MALSADALLDLLGGELNRRILEFTSEEQLDSITRARD
jgi:hypothetical protein